MMTQQQHDTVVFASKVPFDQPIWDRPHREQGNKPEHKDTMPESTEKDAKIGTICLLQNGHVFSTAINAVCVNLCEKLYVLVACYEEGGETYYFQVGSDPKTGEMSFLHAKCSEFASRKDMPKAKQDEQP